MGFTLRPLISRVLVAASLLGVNAITAGAEEAAPISPTTTSTRAVISEGSSSSGEKLDNGLSRGGSRGVRSAWEKLSGGELSGFVAADVRWFFSSPQFPGQDVNALNPSIVLQPEYRYEWNGGNDRVAVVPFARLDFDDEERMHFDLRELNWLHVGSSWDLRAGVGKVFWGVAESRHLVDIINQTDFVEDIDEEDKLGQPMVKLALFRDWGTVALFFLPRFRERTFPGREGRLRFSLPVDADDPEYESSLEEWHPDGALRWSHYIGDWDFGLSHFSGTSREPRFLFGLDASGQPRVVPRYDVIHQTSVDVQATKGNWLWKLEAMTRAGHGDRFAALVAGFEYTFVGILGTATDVGVLGEYLYDGRDFDIPPDLPPTAFNPTLLARIPLTVSEAPPTAFENDLFGGIRITLNDAQSTDFLAGAIVDADTQATLVNVEASRRIGDRWKIELEGRAFVNLGPSDVLFSIRDDDHLQIRLARYF